MLEEFTPTAAGCCHPPKRNCRLATYPARTGDPGYRSGW